MSRKEKKLKVYRGLKIAYYLLGLPLFFFAVVLHASQLYGHNPFMGSAGYGFFDAMTVFFNSPAMYGVWIALLIWVVVGIIQIVCNRFLKTSPRKRGLVVVACMLVCMLVPMLVIDGVYTAKVDAIRLEVEENGELYDHSWLVTNVTTAPGLEVKTYKQHLANFYMRSGGGIAGQATGKKTSYTDTLIDTVNSYLKYYNIPYYGEYKGSVVVQYSDDALYYDQLIWNDNDGYHYGYDYTADGIVDTNDHIIISVSFDKSKEGDFESDRYWFKDGYTFKNINGENPVHASGELFAKIIEQVVPLEYGSAKTEMTYVYVWYQADYNNFVETTGAFGDGWYNTNGLFSDSYVFSLDNALQILNAYYSGQEYTEANYAAFGDAIGETFESVDDALTYIREYGETAREAYYTSDSTSREYCLWQKETTPSNIDGYVLTQDELSYILQALCGKLSGTKLVNDILGLVGSFISSGIEVGPLISSLIGEDLGNIILKKLDLTDVKLFISTSTNNIDLTLKDGVFGAGTTLSINDTDDLLEELKDVVAVLLDTTPTETQEAVVSLLGLIGLSASATVDPVNADAAISDATKLASSLVDVLFNLYNYAPTNLLPIFDFYDDMLNVLDKDLYSEEDWTLITNFLASASSYDRAEYEGNLHGYMIGSRLIGGSLGLGTYDESLGLTSLLQVRQLQLDLSYIPEMYPILIVRDKLMIFTGIAIFFTIMYYMIEQKEEDLKKIPDDEYVYEPKKKAKKKNKDDNEDDKILEDQKSTEEVA